MSAETFVFVNARGSRLSGKIEAPELTPRSWALLAHCFTCGKDGMASGAATVSSSSGRTRK